MCPAGVYEIPEDAPEDGYVDLIVNPSNCVQCGAITAKGGRLTTAGGRRRPDVPDYVAPARRGQRNLGRSAAFMGSHAPHSADPRDVRRAGGAAQAAPPAKVSLTACAPTERVAQFEARMGAGQGRRAAADEVHAAGPARTTRPPTTASRRPASAAGRRRARARRAGSSPAVWKACSVRRATARSSASSGAICTAR